MAAVGATVGATVGAAFESLTSSVHNTMRTGEITKEQFSGATGGLLSIDDDDIINVESQSFNRLWK